MRNVKYFSVDNRVSMICACCKGGASCFIVCAQRLPRLLTMETGGSDRHPSPGLNVNIAPTEWTDRKVGSPASTNNCRNKAGKVIHSILQECKKVNIEFLLIAQCCISAPSELFIIRKVTVHEPANCEKQLEKEDN